MQLLGDIKFFVTFHNFRILQNPSEAAFEDKLRHSGHDKTVLFRKLLQKCPSILEKQRIQRVDSSKDGATKHLMPPLPHILYMHGLLSASLSGHSLNWPQITWLDPSEPETLKIPSVDSYICF